MKTSLRFALFTSLMIISMSMTSKKTTRIVFFGDSITQMGAQPGGYISKMGEIMLSKGISGQYELIGAGIGGNKVYDLYLRIEDDVMAKNPDVVVIWVGVNDVWHKASMGTGTDADKFEKFYETIIRKLQSKGIRVILCTPAAIGEKTDWSNQQDGDLNKYSGIIRNLAGKYKCKLCDFRKLFHDYDLKNNPDNLEKGILTTDGVHLNDKGNQLVADNLLNLILAGN